jgi:capsular exopolysaccharide synthesis family protein
MGYVFDAISKSDDQSPDPAKKPFQGKPKAASGDGLSDTPVPQITENKAQHDAEEPAFLSRTDSEDRTASVDDRLVGLTEPTSVMTEEYRSIRTSILARWENRRHLVHTITSATPQEGKTITSLNLGMTFAELRNRRTVVVEADLRLPQFQKMLALADAPGVIGLLRGDATLDQAVQAVGPNALHVIPAGGKASRDAVQLLAGSNMTALVKQLRRYYDHVIIDTPPVVELADAGIIGGMSDDVYLIARMQRTPQSLVQQAVRTLASYNAPVAGLIATDHQRAKRRYYYRYGQYHYRYAYAKAA